MIPLESCRHGYAYRIRARNFEVGVFNKITAGFVGIREKLGAVFLFEEHHVQHPHFPTVEPLEEIEICPVEDLRTHFDTICFTCRGAVHWIQNDKYGPKTGDWQHVETPPAGCEKVMTGRAAWGSPHNEELFRYLEDLEARLGIPKPKTRPSEKL
jgi:hypothetical protein